MLNDETEIKFFDSFLLSSICTVVFLLKYFIEFKGLRLGEGREFQHISSFEVGLLSLAQKFYRSSSAAFCHTDVGG
jgi:hypothetical protein